MLKLQNCFEKYTDLTAKSRKENPIYNDILLQSYLMRFLILWNDNFEKNNMPRLENGNADATLKAHLYI
jgi:hypothetical protein